VEENEEISVSLLSYWTLSGCCPAVAIERPLDGNFQRTIVDDVKSTIKTSFRQTIEESIADAVKRTIRTAFRSTIRESIGDAIESTNRKAFECPFGGPIQ
jgi:hypothetical protein